MTATPQPPKLTTLEKIDGILEDYYAARYHMHAATEGKARATQAIKDIIDKEVAKEMEEHYATHH